MLNVGDVIEIKWCHCPDGDGKHKKTYEILKDEDFGVYLHRDYCDEHRYAFRSVSFQTIHELEYRIIESMKCADIIWIKVKEVA